MGLTVAPITVRNWLAYKHFIPISLGSGITLIEGIGEYDDQGRFGFPANDSETGLKEAEWYGRPDYTEELWKIDGIERDRARFAKALDVIKANPVWFSRVVLRRMAFMLRYNDFRRQNRTFNHTTAPTVLPFPNFNHPVAVSENALPVWSIVATETLPEPAPSSKISLNKENNILHIQTPNGKGELLTFPTILVKKQTDYILKVQSQVNQGAAVLQVKPQDPRITLAQMNVAVETPRKKKKRQNPESLENLEVTQPSLNFQQLAFTSADKEQVGLVISKGDTESGEMNMQVGRIELFELGPNRHQWTRFPRSIIRGLQKNMFKTDLLRLLIMVGILFLVFIKQYRPLLILLAVPIYYLSFQSFLHTEYRYILAIHYFLFVIVAVAIYYAGTALVRLSRHIKTHF